MGSWRPRLDLILYTKAKYILLFDIGDIYEDNYVLEDGYNIMEKYKLDSLKMTFRIVANYDRLNESMLNIWIFWYRKIQWLYFQKLGKYVD